MIVITAEFHRDRRGPSAGAAHEAAGCFEAAMADYRLALTFEHTDVLAALDGLARCESALGVGENVCK